MPCRSPGEGVLEEELEGSGWGVSRPTPRGEVEGSGLGGLKTYTKWEVKGSGRGGLQAHTQGGGVTQ